MTETFPIMHNYLSVVIEKREKTKRIRLSTATFFNLTYIGVFLCYPCTLPKSDREELSFAD